MNKTYIDYGTYNIWANNKIISCILEQNEELSTKELIGSYPNIRATMLHLWFAEVGWLSRLTGNGWNTEVVSNFKGNLLELTRIWQATSLDFLSFVSTADLKKEILFHHKGQDFSIPSHEIAQTVFNHGSYHRGQIVLMLRQLGVTTIPQTDYIEWVRENARVKK